MNTDYSRISSSLREKLINIVGKENYFDELEIRWTYTFGGTIFQQQWIPDIILTPINKQQISDVLNLATREEIPVTPRGSGTSLSGGPMTPYGGIVVDLSKMNRILEIDIENNLIEVEPGVICDDLNELLKDKGYFFPPDPGSSSVATLGGMVATNAGGIQAFKYGVTKNYVLYMEVVLPNGTILNLGTDVLKSVSSYNLKDLFIGSEGTLGIITKIGLKIRPLPTQRKLGLFIFDDAYDVQNAAIAIRKKGIMPNLLEFMDKTILKAVTEYLAGDFYDIPNGYVLLAEVDGVSEDAVEQKFSEMYDIIMNYNPKFFRIAKTEKERERLILARKANLPALSRIRPTCCVEDCTIQLTDFGDVIKQIERIPQNINAQNLKVATLCHMEGNLHPTFLFNENSESDVKEFERAMDYLYREIILPVGGTLTGEHGIGKIKTPYLKKEHGNKVIDIMGKIKRLFDPNMILNPGIGKGDTRPLPQSNETRSLKNQKEKILELSCMRCGFCLATCPSRIDYKLEAYSPRGRLSILNGVVHGEIELNDLVIDILNTCTLCGQCKVKCPSGVDTYSIFEKTREIIYTKNEKK
mgnify:CR=1 FL=1